MRTLKLVLFLGALIVVFPYSREICAISSFEDQKDGIGYRTTALHQLAETPLQYLGYTLKVHNLRKGFPLEKWSQNCSIVLFWHPDELSPWINNGQELNWLGYLNRQVQSGKRLLLLEQPGFSLEKIYQAGPIQSAYFKLLKNMGLEVRKIWTSQNKAILDDPQQCQGETPTPFTPRRWLQIQPQEGWHGRCRFTDSKNAQSTASLIWTGSKGAFAHPGSLFRKGMVDVGTRKQEWLQWFIDPFYFFNDALGASKTPKWEPSLKFGRRIFYSHVDGDGFLNRSKFPGNPWATDILRDSVLRKYPDFPMTLSMIGAEIHPNFLGSKSDLGRAIELWSLPQVEPSSHTFSHPFVYSNAQKKNYEGAYESYSIVLPNYKLDPIYEYNKSARWMDSIVRPLGKKIKLIQWSGNCAPDETTIAISRQASLMNINGGDSRNDRTFPSISKIAPLGIRIGSELQIYATNSNETIYSEGWQWQYGSLERVIETWQRTSSPRLLRPVNLYFHFYALERIEGLRAFQNIFQWLEHQDLFPMFTSEYVQIAQNALSANIDSLAPNIWLVRPQTKGTTLRFDFATRPNLSQSKNILGYSVRGTQLYIYLDAAEPTKIVLDNSIPQQPFVWQSNGNLSRVQSSPTRWTAEFWSWKAPVLSLGGLSKGQWSLDILCKNQHYKSNLQTQNSLSVHNVSIPNFCNQSPLQIHLEKLK